MYVIYTYIYVYIYIVFCKDHDRGTNAKLMKAALCRDLQLRAFGFRVWHFGHVGGTSRVLGLGHCSPRFRRRVMAAVLLAFSARLELVV